MQKSMTPDSIKQKVRAIVIKRQVLVQLSQQDNLGNLRLDVTQALEEVDDLVAEFQKTFPDAALSELVL